MNQRISQTFSCRIGDRIEWDQIETAMEEPFFFENEGARLFGILHIPAMHEPAEGHRKPQGVVFCSPFAEEEAVSHRVVTNFARLLCREGYYVLRFDYRGCGDSEGDFEQATLTTRLSDIGKAVDLLQGHTGTSPLTLFGLRLGGTLAALVAAKDPRVKSLILWEPVVQVRAYFDQFLRMQVMAENIRASRVVGTRESLLKDLRGNKCVDILGYLLSPQCFREFTKVDVLGRVGAFRGPTLIVAISKRQRKRRDLEMLLQTYQENNTPVEMVHVQDQLFWIDPYNPWRELDTWHGHATLFRQVADWLNTPHRR